MYEAAEDVQTVPGRGVRGMVGGRHVIVGSPAFVGSEDVRADVGESVIEVVVEGRRIGRMEMVEALRPEAANALAALRGCGVVETMMLTGDMSTAAERIGRAAGVDVIYAELLPEQKEVRVRELVERYGAVAMVGDGVNDAPALAAATVGIAMGAGSAQAMETADVTLMGNDLTKLPFVLRLSRAAMRTVRVGIGFAIAVKVVVLLLVLSGLGSLWMAVAADVGAALAVTLAGMQLLRVAPKAAGV